MPTTRIQGKIWFPTSRPQYTIEINGVDRTREVIQAEFVRGIIGTENGCKLALLDPKGIEAQNLTGGEIIELKLTRNASTRSEWKGTLEHPKKRYINTYTLELIGSHYQSDLLEITVTAEYSGTTTADAILKELVDEYLTGFTYSNVSSSNTKPTIKWANKPFHDCILDLCNLANFDAYVDSDKDFNFFPRESNNNTSETIVWNQTLINIEEFGADRVDIRNRIIIYGEDDNGLPIVYRTDDTSSQSINGIKEKVIKDTSIKTYNQAKQFGDALLADEKNKINRGIVNCFLLTDINPGDMVWLVHPTQRIEDQFRVIKYKIMPLRHQTQVIFSKDKTLPLILQERKKADLAKENLSNPFNMRHSFNFAFDDNTEYDSSLSSSITVSDSKLRISNATTGEMISVLRSTTEAVTKVHLKVVGDFLSGATFYVRADESADWQMVNLEEETTLNTSGSNLRFRVDLSSTNTLIDSISLLYR